MLYKVASRNSSEVVVVVVVVVAVAAAVVVVDIYHSIETFGSALFFGSTPVQLVWCIDFHIFCGGWENFVFCYSAFSSLVQ